MKTLKEIEHEIGIARSRKATEDAKSAKLAKDADCQISVWGDAEEVVGQIEAHLAANAISHNEEGDPYLNGDQCLIRVECSRATAMPGPAGADLCVTVKHGLGFAELKGRAMLVTANENGKAVIEIDPE